jgi:hypothetical protein
MLSQVILLLLHFIDALGKKSILAGAHYNDNYHSIFFLHLSIDSLPHVTMLGKAFGSGHNFTTEVPDLGRRHIIPSSPTFPVPFLTQQKQFINCHLKHLTFRIHTSMYV